MTIDSSSACSTRNPLVPNTFTNGRGKQRIDERLAVIQPIRIRIGRTAERSVPFFRKTPAGPPGNSRQTRTRSSFV